MNSFDYFTLTCVLKSGRLTQVRPVMILAKKRPLWTKPQRDLGLPHDRAFGVHFRQPHYLICCGLGPDTDLTLTFYSHSVTCLFFIHISFIFPFVVAVELHFYVFLVNADSGVKWNWRGKLD